MEKQNFNERQFDAFSVKIIKRLIKRDFAGIKDIFEDADSELIARFIDSISEDDDYLKDDETDKEMQAGDNEYDDIIELFRCVPEEKSVEVFARLESEKREKIILHSITNQELDHLIEGLIKKGYYTSLKSQLSEVNEVDIADFMKNYEGETLIKLFRIMPKDMSADVFAYLDSDTQEYIVKSITDKELASLIDDMFIDDTVDFLEEVPANVVKRVLANTNPETRSIINKFLKYPENSAGSIMTIEMMELHDRLTVKEAIEHIRKTGYDKETIYTCYCIDDERKLSGTIGLRELIFNDPDAYIKDIMDDSDHLISVNTQDDQEEVADLARKYDLLSVPVTDNEGRLVGIVTIDDIVDIIEDENTEDIEKMNLIAPSEDEYLKTGVFTLAKNRIIWLMVLMLSATFTGKIIESFEGALAALAGLTACIPMLMDTGGNAGNQASTLIIRGLALGEIKISDYLKVLWKEVRVALICGIALAAVNFGRMYIMHALGSDYGSSPFTTITVVCLAMVCAVIIAKILGCTVPIAAKAIKLDPALMAGPMLTTFVDAITLLIYFALAKLFFGIG